MCNNTPQMYWLSNGKHQALYNILFPRLVPRSGPAPTRHGELLRVMSRIYRAFHNDGDEHVFMLVDMGRVEPRDLRVPEDAPSEAKDLVGGLLGNYEDKDLRAAWDDGTWDEGTWPYDLFRIESEELERAVDEAILYAARKSGLM